MAGERESLEALLARVRDSAAPDPGLDASLAAAFQQGPWDGRVLDGWDGPIMAERTRVYATTKEGGRSTPWSAQPYTASLDAALTLVRATGHVTCDLTVHVDGKFPSEACIRTWEASPGGTVGRGPTYRSEAPTAPLAVVRALLTAMIAEASHADA